MKKSNVVVVETPVAQSSEKVKKTFPALDAETQAQLDQLQSVSSKIRFLHALGWSKGDISRKLEKRFQHVRNVLLQPLKSQQA